MFWDFISLRPETTHQVSFLFSDRGIPDGYRHMNGYGSHTFKLVNKDREVIYCKFHFKVSVCVSHCVTNNVFVIIIQTDQKIKNIFAGRAAQIAGTDPDYGIRDLYDSIAKGDYVSPCY